MPARQFFVLRLAKRPCPVRTKPASQEPQRLRSAAFLHWLPPVSAYVQT